MINVANGSGCPCCQGYPPCRDEVSDDVAFVLGEAVAGLEAANALAPARDLMFRVLTLHPACSGAIVCLGAWYGRQGRVLEAIRCFQEAQKVRGGGRTGVRGQRGAVLVWCVCVSE